MRSKVLGSNDDKLIYIRMIAARTVHQSMNRSGETEFTIIGVQNVGQAENLLKKWITYCQGTSDACYLTIQQYAAFLESKVKPGIHQGFPFVLSRTTSAHNANQAKQTTDSEVMLVSDTSQSLHTSTQSADTHGQLEARQSYPQNRDLSSDFRDVTSQQSIHDNGPPDVSTNSQNSHHTMLKVKPIGFECEKPKDKELNDSGSDLGFQSKIVRTVFKLKSRSSNSLPHLSEAPHDIMSFSNFDTGVCEPLHPDKGPNLNELGTFVGSTESNISKPPLPKQSVNPQSKQHTSGSLSHTTQQMPEPGDRSSSSYTFPSKGSMGRESLEAADTNNNLQNVWQGEYGMPWSSEQNTPPQSAEEFVAEYISKHGLHLANTTSRQSHKAEATTSTSGTIPQRMCDNINVQNMPRQSTSTDTQDHAQRRFQPTKSQQSSGKSAQESDVLQKQNRK